MTPHTQVITIRDILRSIFRNKLLVVIPIIPAILTAYILTELQTPIYEGSVKMMVAGVVVGGAPHYRDVVRSGDEAIATQMELVKSRYVIERVVRTLKLYDTPPDYEKYFTTPLKRALIEYNSKKFKVKKSIGLTQEQEQAIRINEAVATLTANTSVKSILGTGLFIISVRDFDPLRAAIIANSVSRSYVLYSLEQQIAELRLTYGDKHEKIRQIKSFIEGFQKTLDGSPLSDMDAIGPSGDKIVDQAKIPAERVAGIDIQRIRMLVFLLSIAFGLILAIVVEYFNQTFKSPGDIETFLNIPSLGSIPKKKSKNKSPIGINTNSTAEYTHSYHNVSEQMLLLMNDKNLQVVLITGVESPSDIATVASSIGIYASNGVTKNDKILLGDAILRTPCMPAVFNIASNPGLVDVLKGRSTFEDAVKNLGPNLYILPSGTTELNPITLLGSSAMADVMRTAKNKYKIILISCASLKDSNDAVVLSSVVDGIVLVINEGKVKRLVVKEAINPLVQKGNLIGAILNNRTFAIPKWVYDRI